MNALEADNQALPSIDLRIFWINIQYKLLIPILVGALIAVGSYKLLSVLIENKWESSTFLIRHSKNMSSQTDIPYLYLQTDTSTVMETILLRDNLLSVIAQKDLDTTPEKLRNNITIQKGSKSKVIEVKVTWSDREMAAEIADLISETFLANYTNIQNAAATKLHQYYLAKLESTQGELYESRRLERHFMETQNILDFVAQKDNLYRSMSTLELRLIDEKVRASDIQSRAIKVSQQLGSISEKTIISQLLRTNEGNRTKELKNQLEVLKKRYTIDNPKVKHLLHKIAVLELEQASNKSDQLKFDEVEYGTNPVFEQLSLRKLELDSLLLASVGNIKKYQASLLDISERISMLAKQEQNHYQLQQNITSNENLVNKINDRLIETSLALESNISDFDILEHAQLAEFPKRSYRKMIAIVLAFLATIALTAFIIIREFINNTIKTAFDLQHISNAKFCAVLPDKDQTSHQVFYSQFQLLFSNTHQAFRDKKNHLLTVASIGNGDGKSFIAQEFANSFDKLNKRILHIESDELLDNVPENSIINQVVNDGGSCKEVEPLELSHNLDKCYFQIDQQIYLDILQDENLHTFLTSCYEQYDLVIWELFSPNTHLQLFKTITKQAGFNLLMVKSQSTPKTALNNTLKMFDNWEINHVGVLLNGLPKKYIKCDV